MSCMAEVDKDHCVWSSNAEMVSLMTSRHAWEMSVPLSRALVPEGTPPMQNPMVIWISSCSLWCYWWDLFSAHRDLKEWLMSAPNIYFKGLQSLSAAASREEVRFCAQREYKGVVCATIQFKGKEAIWIDIVENVRRTVVLLLLQTKEKEKDVKEKDWE